MLLQSDSDLNHMELLRTLVLVVWAFGTYFLFCECGEMVTNQFEKFMDVLDQCNWHLFSIELQQMFVVVVANSQQLSVVRGYGNILCARRSFKAVSIVHVFAFFLEMRKKLFIFLYFSNWFRHVKLVSRISRCFVKLTIRALDIDLI